MTAGFPIRPTHFIAQMPTPRREEDVSKSDVLIERMYRATAIEQPQYLRSALRVAFEEGRITRDTLWAAIEWVDRGAYESAALTLVPEGWTWSADASVPGWKSKFTLHGPGYDERVEGIGLTPALALCIAALRAAQSLPKETG